MGSLNINSWNPFNWTYTKFANGDSFLKIGRLSSDYRLGMSYLKATMDNYALFICIFITAEICSKAKFKVVDKEGNEIENDPLLKVIDNPNYLQTSKDFIKQWIWYKLSLGKTAIRPIMPAGLNITPDNVLAMYNLNYSKITFPDDFTTPMLFEKGDIDDFFRTVVTYEEFGEKKTFELRELLFFYDIAAGLGKHMLDSPSRIDAIKKSISNINLGLDSENIMLQTNGREIFSGAGKEGSHSGANMPMQQGDRNEILTKLLRQYGMRKDQIRSIVTNNKIDWQSLHIALKDLGLWESATKNASIIRSAFNIPETIFKLYYEGGDTYENKKEGQVQLIQDVAQSQLEDLCKSITSFFQEYLDSGKKLIATFDHLEAMQYIEERKADRLLKISASIRNLTQAGLEKPDMQQILNDSNINVEL